MNGSRFFARELAMTTFNSMSATNIIHIWSLRNHTSTRKHSDNHRFVSVFSLCITIVVQLNNYLLVVKLKTIWETHQKKKFFPWWFTKQRSVVCASFYIRPHIDINIETFRLFLIVPLVQLLNEECCSACKQLSIYFGCYNFLCSVHRFVFVTRKNNWRVVLDFLLTLLAIHEPILLCDIVIIKLSIK